MTDRWFRTNSGFWLNLDTLDVSGYTIEAMAYDLSLERRFSGAGINVAAHSTLVLEHVKRLQAEAPGYWVSSVESDSRTTRARALIHDGSEGLGLRDLASPWKHLPRMECYRLAERDVMVQLCDRFALPRVSPAVVRHADRVVGRTELLEVYPDDAPNCWGEVRPLSFRLPRWSEQESIERFCSAAEEMGIR